MSVAKIIELSATSEESYEDAIRQAIVKASETLHGIQSAWVKEMKVEVADGMVSRFVVHLDVTFVLD